MSEDDGMPRRTAMVRALFMVALGGAVVAMLFITTLTATQNREALEQATENGQQIKNCTTPGGDCFLRAARLQARVIGDPPAPINDVVILAAACADRPGVDTEDEIRKCVRDGLR